MPIDLRRARPARPVLVPALVGLLVAVFVGLTAAVWWEWAPLLDLDQAVADAAHDAVAGREMLIDTLLWVADGLGPWTLRIVMGLTVLVAVWRRAYRLAVWIALTIAVQFTAVYVIKRTVDRSRPAFDDPFQTLTSYSFPSGHATAGATFSTVMVIVTLLLMRRGLLRKAVITVWILLGLAAGLDRIFLGVHYLSDVVAGFALGTAIPLALWWLLMRPVFAVEEPSHPGVSGTGRRQVGVVLNPVKVGDVAAFRERVAEAAARHGWAEPVFFETTVDDPGAAQAVEALEGEADLVIVAGGDGTVREACGELARSGIGVGIVPLGTGNLLARNLSLPLHLVDAIDNAFTGQDRAVDVVRLQIDGSEDSTTFLVMAGVGFDAAVMTGTNEQLKKKVGWLAYVVSGATQVLRFPTTRVQIAVDGGAFVRRRALTVIVGNVGFLQGGLPLLPDAQIDDGVLDVVAISPPHKFAFLSVGLRLFARGKRTDERLDRMTGRTVTIRTDRPAAMQLDGDPIGEHTELCATVEPGVLLVRVPR
ncbi:phosphatase PAP2 family protein [Mumia sp. zg.B21]|uniref:diacylglycerol kinase family protein n=1 Tax=Mumia sp. zg.B21 TaxID=2855447 RepID=UPI001C6E27D4|nr:diacylglycerol kinase family protein [Mumia sp. zg.B21]MBW9210074.1 phosphatase PAP2 family protein [Mumia sp. zg.B21]